MILQEFRKRRVGVLALCSYGRSGTSFFMQVLQAAGVTVLGAFPFEDRAVQVSLLHWLRRGFAVPGQEVPDSGGLNRAQFRGVGYGSQTFATVASDEAMAALLAELARSIAATAPPGSRWLGEKFLGFETLRLCRAFDPDDLVLPLFLLRDPRAIFLSIREFNARRGHVSFNDTGDDDHLLKTICQFEDRQLAEQARLGGVVCRYEDFVSHDRRDAALVALLQRLRLPATPAAVAKVWAQVDGGRAKVADHITNASAAGYPEAYRALFATHAALLGRIGYPAA